MHRGPGPAYPPRSRGGRGSRRGGQKARGTHTRALTSAPSAAFNQTLQFITSIKLQELEKQRLEYGKHSQVLHESRAAGDNLLVRVQMLLDAIRSWSGSGALDRDGVVGGKLDLTNLDQWLLLAKNDPSFSSDVIRGWIDTLEAHINQSLARFDCAKLFGKLFNEWLSSGDSITANNASRTDSGTPVEADEFVNVGRQEMHEQKERLSALIFQPKPVDTNAIVQYLSELFSGEAAEEALKTIREKVEYFGDSLLRATITPDDIRASIKGLLASDGLDETKRMALREFTENPTVLSEVASVLNMRLGNLGSWSWPATGIDIEMRRHLNGKYRAFTSPDILDAIFLQHLGTQWQVQFKLFFRYVFQSKAWKQPFAPLSKIESDRRQYYLHESQHNDTIQHHRKWLQETCFVASQLSSSVGETSSYDDDNADDDDDAYNGQNNPSSAASAASAINIKQKLLHLMATECYLNTALSGRHTSIRTDFEWFGPSLSHASILTLLEFFGLSRQWLDFFQTFLRTPLRFKEEPGAALRTRECGTPISYALSTLFGEVVLFVLDFAVNQRTGGSFLYRIHDDIWLWDAEPEKCVTAWQEMNRYASLVGLKFNESKTGSACVGGSVHPDLPPGDIRWGFLKFDSQQSRFVIDQKDVDKHIAELRRQLAATKSVFGWVNLYNKYMAFLVRNFGGRPANCFGQVHVDDMMQTLSRVQQELFPEIEGGAVGYLRSILEARFGVRDLPQGYFYFPITSGGLAVRNPMIELLALREDVLSNPEAGFLDVMKIDQKNYDNLKQTWQSSSPYAVLPRDSAAVEFMPYDEYISRRETRLGSWRHCYTEFLEVSEPDSIELTPAIEAAIKSTWKSSGWDNMDFNDQWVVSLYGEELMKNYGSLEVVDPTLIPVGMVQLFQSSRVRLDQ